MQKVDAEKLESIIARYKELTQLLLASAHIAFDERLRGALPVEGGVYRVFEIGANWQDSVYIGKSTNLQNRIYHDHLMGNRQASTLKKKLIANGLFPDENAVKQYLRQKCLVQFVVIQDDAERTSFEHFAVAVLRPKYND